MTQNLQPYQQRVVDELNDLSGRTLKLSVYLGSGAPGASFEEKQLLHEQFHAMEILTKILQRRIALWTATAEPDFLAGVKACDLSGEGNCEACQ